jgi:hypothetical protein
MTIHWKALEIKFIVALLALSTDNNWTMDMNYEGMELPTSQILNSLWLIILLFSLWLLLGSWEI